MSLRHCSAGFRKPRAGRSRSRLAFESLEDRLVLDGVGLAAPATDNVIKWTFGDTQNNLYVLKSFSPQDANVGPIGALDPSLNLIIGVRYMATVASFPHHPLELIAGAASPFDDIVVLAQTNKGEPLNQTAEWESDPGVDWQTDPAAKSVSFTLTPALAAALFNPALGLTPQYRCGNPFHRGFQRGALLFSSGTPAPKDAPHDGFGATLADASSLTLDSQGSANVDGTLEASGSIDTFRYVASATGLLTVTQAAAPDSHLNSLLLIDNGSQQLVDVGGTGVPGATGEVQIPVVAGNTYYIQASGYQGSTGAFHLTVTGQPLKTVAIDAKLIALDARGSANLNDAVSVLGGRNSYQITATAAGEMTITQSALSGSSIDPLLLVYNSAGILVASDNEGAGGQISQVQFSVQPGQTDEVGAGSLGLTLGSYSLSISTQDSGDSLAQAVTVSLSDQGTASVSGQVDTAGEADYFQFVAPFSGLMAVEQDTAPGSSMRVAPTVLDTSGNSLPVVSQTNLAGASSVRVVFPVVAGQVYTIRAGAEGEDTGGDTVYIAPAPPLESFASMPTISLSNTGYATLPGAIGFPGASVQYRFTAPVSGLLAISQQASGGTPLDSVLSVYDASGTLLANDDDGGSGRDSLIKITVTAGQTYSVRAAGFGHSTGQFTLTLATDNFGHDFQTASPINLDASGSGRVSGAIGWSGDTDVFQFVLSEPQDLTIALAAAGGTFDGVIQVYDSQFNSIAQNDDDEEDDYDSKVSVSLSADQTYYVAVSGHGSSIGGYNLFVGNGLGSDPAHAFPITLDPQGLGSQSGTIDKPGEVTTFQVVAPASGLMTVVQLSAPEGSFMGNLLVLDASGTVVASQADQYVGFGPSSLGDNDELSSEMAKVMVPAAAGQTYYVQVSGQGTLTGEYVIDVAFNDAGANTSQPVSKDVTLDPSSHSAGFDGQIALPGDLEVFRLTAPVSGELVINQTAPPGSFIGSVVVTQPGTSNTDSDNAAVGGEDPQDAGKGYSRLAFQVTAGQTYVIQVSGVATSIGSFHLDLREFPATSQNLATQDLAQSATPEKLVATMLGAGNTTVQIVPGSVVYTGASNASGLFSGGSGILDSREGGAVSFDSGVVLTNGNASNIIGPNDNNAASEVNGLPGSPYLDKLVRGGTLDGSTLTFQFIPTTNVIQLRYVFASEEYDTYVGTPFDDVFGFFVNGSDYSRVPGTGTPLAGTGDIVSVNTINSQVNSQYYIDNTFAPIGGFGHLNTQMNGLTRVLTMQAPVKAGQVNTIVLTIADTLDPQVDSAVLVQAGSFQSVHEQVAPVAGEQVFSQLVQTVSRLTPLVARGRLTTSQLQFSIQQAVVNGVLKAAQLTGDFMIIPVDPVDFTLTGANGLQVSSSAGQGVAGNVPNVFSAADGENQLLIIPNANPGEYQVSLVGTGSGELLFGASFISTSSGQVTSVLLNGNLQGTSTTAILDFQNPNGQFEQETIGTQSPTSSPGGGSSLAAGLTSSALTALGVVITQLTFPELTALSVGEPASTPATAAALAPITQPLPSSLARLTRESNQEPPSPSGLSQALVALWEAVENRLGESRLQLDALLGKEWASTLADVITTLRPGLKTSQSLLESLVPLVRTRIVHGARAQPRKDSLPSQFPGVSSPPASPPGNTAPKSSSLPMPPSEGAVRVEVPAGHHSALPPTGSSSGTEPCSGSVALPIVLAGMGMTRLADRQALRLAGRRKKCGAAPDRPLLFLRAGNGLRRVE